MLNNGLPPLTSPHSEPVPEFHSPSYEASTSTEATSPSYDRKSIPRKREAPSYEAEGYAHHHASPQTPSQHSRQRMNSSTLMPPPLPPTHLDQDQILPSPVLSHLLSIGGPIYIHGFGTGPRWMMGNTTSYAKATLTIGRDDPRMNAISIGIVPMEKARALFMLYV